LSTFSFFFLSNVLVAMHFYFRNANRPLRTHSPHQHLYGAHHVPNDHHWVEHALAPTWKPCVRNCAQKPWMIDVCTLHWYLGSLYILFSLLFSIPFNLPLH
jgi:hypothetical protein